MHQAPLAIRKLSHRIQRLQKLSAATENPANHHRDGFPEMSCELFIAKAPLEEWNILHIPTVFHLLSKKVLRGIHSRKTFAIKWNVNSIL